MDRSKQGFSLPEYYKFIAQPAERTFFNGEAS
jgi:hypothetical protein